MTDDPFARWWFPRLWSGRRIDHLLTLLGSNINQLDWLRSHVAAACLAGSSVSTVLSVLRRLSVSAASNECLRDDPIIIIGHWRSGTTLLHELLSLDPRHTYASTYACLMPHHFALTEAAALRGGAGCAPRHRPMDRMPFGWERPQEDEFAVCNLNAASPYGFLAFPQQIGSPEFYATLGLTSEEYEESWRRAFLWFCSVLSSRSPNRLILKSPVHSFRVRQLLDIFPSARFVYITRDPLAVYPSTVHMWSALIHSQALGRGRPNLKPFVRETFLRHYEAVEDASSALAPDQLLRLTCEDLVREPVVEVERLYDWLGSSISPCARQRLEQYAREMPLYRSRSYCFDEAEAEAVSEWWNDAICSSGCVESGQ